MWRRRFWTRRAKRWPASERSAFRAVGLPTNVIPSTASLNCRSHMESLGERMSERKVWGRPRKDSPAPSPEPGRASVALGG